jgi:hypothetical protein
MPAGLANLPAASTPRDRRGFQGDEQDESHQLELFAAEAGRVLLGSDSLRFGNWMPPSPPRRAGHFRSHYAARLYAQAARDAERIRSDPAELAEIKAVSEELDEISAW